RPGGIGTMTSQSSAQGRFQRTIERRNAFQAHIAAHELGSLSLSDALSLCLLYGAEGDPGFERAFRRWLGRMSREKDRVAGRVGLLRGAAGALGPSSGCWRSTP